MRCALFGKVASKRDFVAVHAPRHFLEPWERWIQSGMSASRQELGNDWQSAYLKAPIWRFWIGEDICGSTAIGAFMPSVDGVGRYFPLTVFACADEGEAIPPPELEMQADWFGATEDFMLSTLDHGVSYEAIIAALDRLDVPLAGRPASKEANFAALPRGVVGRLSADQSFSDVFATMRVQNHARAYAASTFWWTIGGEDFRPTAFGGSGMPDPFLFTEMLTGRFGLGLE